LQTNAENPANYTEITLDDIKSGRVAYFEHQAYNNGTLPQFSPNAQYLPLIISHSTLYSVGLDFDTINPDWHSIQQGQYSHPDTQPMRFVTYYKMKTDSGDEIWIAGLEVLNKDGSVSFLHAGFDPKIWGADTHFDEYLQDTSLDLRVPGIVSRTNTCEDKSASLPPTMLNGFSKICNIYTKNWDMENSATTLEAWSNTGQVSTDMEKIIYIYTQYTEW